jgi:hypothetical protein
MKKVLGAVVVALCLAGPVAAADQPPGQALSPEVVPDAGLTGVAGAQATIVRVLHGVGSVQGAVFQVGRTKVVFVDPVSKIRFTSLRVQSVRFGTNAARLRGIGLANGHRVGFTAVAVHNARPGIDVFRIAWNHGASLGGTVDDGSVFIR